MSFLSFDFDQRILAGIRAAGYETPTPIQTRAMPVVLAGRDVLGLAQTGTGKTAAFALPILQRLLAADAPKRGPVRVLVLAPTRELALQIHESFVDLGRQTGIRSTAVFGGVGIFPQVKALTQTTIVVACPGRLLDLVNRGQVNLSQVDTLVLDEADRMLDMGFLPDVKKILARLPAARQNLLFSATMPTAIDQLAGAILKRPEKVQVDNTRPAAGVSHALYPVPSHLKPELLEALIAATDYQALLVFTKTKHRAKTLARRLSEKGLAVVALQGNLSQNRRQEALSGFKAGKYKIMVATDIAARGIDCVDISHVVNFDMPDSAETYTHRIGRTGRAERSGASMTLVTGEDMGIVGAIERTLGAKISRERLADFDYQAAGRPTRPAERRDTRPGSRPDSRSEARYDDRPRRASRPATERESRDTRDSRPEKAPARRAEPDRGQARYAQPQKPRDQGQPVQTQAAKKPERTGAGRDDATQGAGTKRRRPRQSAPTAVR